MHANATSSLKARQCRNSQADAQRLAVRVQELLKHQACDVETQIARDGDRRGEVWVVLVRTATSVLVDREGRS